MESCENNKRLWAVVLAGGDGERMQPTIRFWMGRSKPKQYCAFTGKRSMLEHTLDRARELAPQDRILTVIGRGHRAHMERETWERLPGRILEQPDKRGTLPGILFPLSYILKEDPQATLLLLPSDHFVHPESRFLRHMEYLVSLVEQQHGRVGLLGAEPDGPQPDYGWIEPGPIGSQGIASVFAVSRFDEKPSDELARQYWSQGYLWNTMITAVKAQTLWALVEFFHAELARRFKIFSAAIGTDQEGGVLDAAYQDMPAVDFSRGILEPAADRILVRLMEGVAWSDWGRPERVMEALAKIGRRPQFTADFLPQPQTCAEA